MNKTVIVLIAFIAHCTTTQEITIFAHGIVDGPIQMERFAQVITTEKSKAVTFADHNRSTGLNLNHALEWFIGILLGKHVNRTNMYMGQGHDVTTLHTMCSNYADAEIIAYGCSRGACAWINYLATYQPKNIKALILDAASASMPNDLKKPLAQCGINPTWSNDIFSHVFIAYPQATISPLEQIAYIKDKSLPILLIHSKNDSRVNVTNAYQLYQTFLDAGFCNVHLVIVPDGKHSFILQDQDTTIVTLYTQAVHAFYKKYNISYHPTAIDSDFDLEAHKPSNDGMRTLIIQYQKDIEEIYKKASQRNKYITLSLLIVSALLLINKKQKQL